jgi:DNA-binding response OmpR family regulator
VAEVPAIAESVAAPERIAVLGAAGTRVLIVDDNVDAADSLARLLEVYGYTTKVAYDAGSALEIANILRPTIVLLDLGLPDLSGDQVAQRIRAEAWGATAQIIAVTGWGQESDRRKTRDAGFNEHLTKPVDPEVLLRLIAQATREVA